MYDDKRKTGLRPVLSARLWHGVAAAGLCQPAASPGRQRRGLPAAAGGEHVLPAGVRSAGAKVLAASAHRHQLAAPPERQRQVSAGGMVRPGGIHRAGSGAVLCGVPVPAGHLRQLAGHGLWRAVDTGSPENRAGSDHDQLPDPVRSAGGHAGTACQYDPRCGRGSGLARFT